MSSGVCAVNNILYVVGGDDGSCNLASVEFYNPNSDKWTLLPTCMSTGRSYAGRQHVNIHVHILLRLWSTFIILLTDEMMFCYIKCHIVVYQ